MPTRYVLDAHAWAEYLRGSPPGRRVRELVESGSVYTTAVTLAELAGHVARQGEDVPLAVRAVQTVSEIVPIDSELAVKAAERSVRGKIPLRHAYVIEAAKRLGAEIVSGDRKLGSARVIQIL